MNDSTVCFINSGSLNERILVSDARSAETLKRLLAQLAHEKWVLQTEIEENLNDLQDEFKYTTTLPVNQLNNTNFRVLIICGSATFRSSICEISSEAMTLKTTAPLKFNQMICLAYISFNQMLENIEVHCKVVTEWNGVSRLELINPTSSDLEKLSDWMSAAATI